MDQLSSRALLVYQYLFTYQREHGFPPSLQEIMKETGINSLRGVTLQLDKLQELKLIHREKNSRRSLKILIPPDQQAEEKMHVPLVGEIRAGEPALAEQNIEEHKEIPISLLRGRRDAYLLRIKGTSMNKAGYMPGDIVIVAPTQNPDSGDIVVAFTPEENSATLKKFRMMDGYFLLIPQSDDPQYKPFIGEGFTIQGKVIGKL